MTMSMAMLKRVIRNAQRSVTREFNWFHVLELSNDDFGALKQSLAIVTEASKEAVDSFAKFPGELEEEEHDEIDQEVQQIQETACALARVLKKEIEIIEHNRRTSIGGDDSSQRESGSQSSLSVPTIQIPKFDGKPENWIAFRDMFEVLVHRHASIEKIVKFQYLRDAVELPAGEINVLDQHSVSEDGYEEAWKSLNDRYNDKRKILCALLHKMFTCKPMKNGSAEEIRRVLDTFQSSIRALERWEYPLERADDIANLLIAYMVTSLFDDETRREWNKVHKCDTATWEELSEFLIALWRSLDDIRPASKSQDRDTRVKGRAHVSSSDSNRVEFVCFLCNEAHRLWSCSRFLEMDVDHREDFVKKNGLCLNCLSKGHRAAECKSKFKCGQCSRAHHTLIHYPRSSRTSESEDDGECSGMSNVAKTFVSSNQHLMSTVTVKVFDRDGKAHELRALLDNGSDTNFITSHAAKRLRLTKTKCSKAIAGISGGNTTSRFKVDATVKSLHTDFTQKLEFFVLDRITGNLPSRNVDKKKVNLPFGTQLADPMFHRAGRIDMLLNGDVCNSSSLDKTIELSSGQYLKRTQFGWVVNGQAQPVSSHGSTYLSCSKVTPARMRELNDKGHSASETMSREVRSNRSRSVLNDDGRQRVISRVHHKKKREFTQEHRMNCPQCRLTDFSLKKLYEKQTYVGSRFVAKQGWHSGHGAERRENSDEANKKLRTRKQSSREVGVCFGRNGQDKNLKFKGKEKTC